MSAVEHIQHEVDEIVGVMKGNISKLIDRDVKLEQLESDSERLKDDASFFRTSSRRLKTRHWWRNAKLKLGVVVVVVIIVGVIVLLAV